MRARLVEPALIGKAWPLVEQWVTAALAKGKADIGPEDVRRQLAAGLMQLWLAWDDETKRARGCCVTELFGSVRGKGCNLVAIGGHDFEQWHHLVEAIKTWARAEGCVRLESGSRAGIVPKMKKAGWRPIRTIMEKRLDDGQQ